MIKFLDIKKINDRDSHEIKEAVNKVIDSGWYILGKEVERFEKEFADFHKSKHVIATSNGLDALRLIIKAYLELGVFTEGDEILVPANTFIASVLAISDAKLKPVLVEVSKSDFLIDTKEIEKHITPKTKGIMNVHLYGQISYSEALENIIDKNNLIHIEDNAQAIGAFYKNKMSGTLGDASAVSFYPGKNLGALGDAGAIVTNNSELANVCKILANYGSEKKYVHNYKGNNNRMDEIQAAVLNVKLQYIQLDNQRRQEIAEYYVENIRNSRIKCPTLPSNKANHVWHLFVVQCKNRDLLQTHLKDNNIESLIHYPIPIHKQHSYINEVESAFEITEQLSNEILSIPISPVMSDLEVEEVVRVINTF